MTTKRTIGTLLSIALAVALGGTTTLGQTSPSAEGEVAGLAVAVVGTSTLVGEAEPGTSALDGAIVRVRDNVLITVEASSDPRVSGRATITVNFDAYPDETGLPGATQVRYGEMRLENDDGSWVGHFAGSLANGGFVQTYWLQGEGDYEGLSYVVTAGGNGNVWRSQGLIFPGPIPPMASTPRLPFDATPRELPAA